MTTQREVPSAQDQVETVRSLPEGDDTIADDESYSTFTRSQKFILMTLISIAGFFSPFTAFVYFPSLRSIGKDLDVSMQMMNITVTAYLIVQAIVPSLFGDLAKHAGRRPVYLFKFSLYTLASVLLAIQRSYPALLLLRMLQSAGSSATVALAWAVISDIAPPHDRGYFVGVAHIGFNLAPALGPVLGGLLSDRLGWSSIFVFLAFAGGITFVLLLLFLDETGRNIVGNGSISSVGINRPLYQYLRHGRSKSRRNRARFVIPSILPSIRLIFHWNTFLVLFANAVFYLMYSVLQATLASTAEERYGFTPFQAGLCYIGYGVAGAFASLIIGKITDRDYRITAMKYNMSIDRKKGDDLLHFPIEQARLRTIWVYIISASIALLSYGWTIELQGHIVVAIAFLAVVAFSTVGVFNVCNSLVVDVNPEESASASAAVSITRCLFGAAGVAVVEPLLQRIGHGWTFTVISALCLGTIIPLVVEFRKGWEWRVQRHKRNLEETRGTSNEQTPLLMPDDTSRRE